MKQALKLTLGLFALTTLALAGRPAPAAAADAPGPYYAWPSWDQTLPAATRFIVLTNMASAAVLDRETGLVWERSPDATTLTWVSAQFLCTTRTVGNRKGWRLPTIQELASLVDPSVGPGPTLPAGHPFTNVQSSVYWSATSSAGSAIAARYVHLIDGFVFASDKAFELVAWCVRGRQGGDPQ